MNRIKTWLERKFARPDACIENSQERTSFRANLVKTELDERAEGRLPDPEIQIDCFLDRDFLHKYDETVPNLQVLDDSMFIENVETDFDPYELDVSSDSGD